MGKIIAMCEHDLKADSCRYWYKEGNMLRYETGDGCPLLCFLLSLVQNGDEIHLYGSMSWRQDMDDVLAVVKHLAKELYFRYPGVPVFLFPNGFDYAASGIYDRKDVSKVLHIVTPYSHNDRIPMSNEIMYDYEG